MTNGASKPTPRRKLVLCTACARHVRATEPRCPFCGAGRADRSLAAQAAFVALAVGVGGALSTAACDAPNQQAPVTSASADLKTSTTASASAAPSPSATPTSSATIATVASASASASGARSAGVSDPDPAPTLALSAKPPPSVVKPPPPAPHPPPAETDRPAMKYGIVPDPLSHP